MMSTEPKMTTSAPKKKKKNRKVFKEKQKWEKNGARKCEKNRLTKKLKKLLL